MIKLRKCISVLLMILTLSSVFTMSMTYSAAEINEVSTTTNSGAVSGYFSSYYSGTLIEWFYNGAGTLTIKGDNDEPLDVSEWDFNKNYDPDLFKIIKNIKHIKVECVPEFNIPLEKFTQLRNIEFDKNLRSAYGFSNCKNLESVKLPETIENLPYFDGCSKLKSFKIPSGFTEINSNNFSGCSSLTNIVIPDSVTKIDWNAFSYCTSLKSIIIPKSVKYIESSAFAGCRSLTSIVLPEKVTTISDSLFENCTNLKTIKYSKNLKKVSSKAFANCASLKSFKLPSNITVIKEGTFSGCKSLTGIKIPSSVKEIGNNAFANCESITSSDIPSKVTTINDNAFNGCKKIKTINISKNVNYIGKKAFANCGSLKSINVKKANKKYATVNGSLYNKKKDTLLSYPSGKTATYKVANGTKYIGAYAFSGAKVKKVILPNTVCKIYGKAFQNCTNLGNINIPASVYYISIGVFNNTKYYNTAKCWYKGQLYVSNCVVDSKKNIKSAVLKPNTRLIASSAYKDRKELTTVKLSNNLKYINTQAFFNCTKVKKTTLPKSIKSIGKQALGYYRCTTIRTKTYGSYVLYKDCTLIRDNFTLSVYKNSIGHKYAKNNILDYTVIK